MSLSYIENNSQRSCGSMAAARSESNGGRKWFATERTKDVRGIC